MSKEQLKIPRFGTFEEFLRWWQGNEVVQFLQRHPDKLSQLRDHSHVKPWIIRLKDADIAPITQQSKGQVFGKYILEKKLGQGGMGVVYLAFDPTLNRRVALKIMLLKGQTAIERFMREARSMARLKHPNIIDIYEVDTTGNYHYIAMNYVDGEALEKLTRDKKVNMTLKDIARVMRKIALALDYAHSEGVIHRDVKPANILIDGNTGEPYLTDFGLAKELAGTEHSLTLSGTVVGTPDYMSPEQAMGHKNDIDHISDIFSLGSTLYHCLTGRVPFPGKELYQVMNNVVNKEPVPPRKFVDPLDRDIETICLKCLEKERRRRYQTAREFAEDLNRYVEGETILAKPAGLLTKAWRNAKQHRAAAAVAGGSLFVLLAVILSLAVSASDRKSKIAEYRQEAFNAYTEKKYDDALVKCNKVLALDPDNDEIKTLLRDCETAKKNEDERLKREKEAAQVEIDKKRAADETRQKAKAVLDRITSAAKPFPVAERIKIAMEAISVDPSFGEAYQLIGYAYKDAGDLKNAYEYFSRAIEISPGLTYSYFERARIIAKLNGNTVQVLKDLDKVIELDPNSSIAHYAKGVTLTEMGRNDEAIASYTKAIKIFPEYEDAFVKRAVLYSQKGDTARALDDYNKVLGFSPKNSTVHVNCGAILESEGRDDEALKAYTNAILANIKCTSAYHRRGLLFGRKAKYADAIEDLNTCLSIDPNYPFAKDVNMAIEYYDKMLKQQER